MKKYKKFFLLIIFLLFFMGCATMYSTPNSTPTQQEIDNLDYGSPIIVDYQSMIKNHFEETLFDPYSAHYKFTPPVKAWYKEPFSRNGLYAGYMVFVSVNAKNRMGGYTGYSKYGFLFKDNKIIKILDPDDLSITDLK